jgi:hypothetical protein
MSRALTIEADWERSESTAPEERACFAVIGILYHDLWLTAAEDAFVKRVRPKVHLSAYHFAEWLAWNWWRLRWEPRRRSVEWAMAHRMTTIGSGYVWPNIAIISDGERILLSAQPTKRNPAEPLRYLSNIAAVVQAGEFESVVDLFVKQVRGRLSDEKIDKSNLEAVWTDVLSERADPEAARTRILEALLGFDPGEGDQKTIDRLLQDSKRLGEPVTNELAADDPGLNSSQLEDLAHQIGTQANPQDAVTLPPNALPTESIGVPAWERGAKAAIALRSSQQLGDSAVTNDKLCKLAGVNNKVLEELRDVGEMLRCLRAHQEKDRFGGGLD